MANMSIMGPGADLLTIERSPSALAPFGIFTVAGGTTVLLSDLTAANADNTGIANSGNLTLKAHGRREQHRDRTPTPAALRLPGRHPERWHADRAAKHDRQQLDRQFPGGRGHRQRGRRVVIIDSTISGNVANDTNSAGGVGIYGGSLLLENSTITGNTPGGLDAFGYSDIIVNTIVAGNNSDDVQIGLGRLTSLGHNLIGMASTFAQKQYFIASDLVGTSAAPVNPLLATALANNGGPTPTFAELAGSPAIAAGDPTTRQPIARLSARDQWDNGHWRL